MFDNVLRHAGSQATRVDVELSDHLMRHLCRALLSDLHGVGVLYVDVCEDDVRAVGAD